MNLMKGMVASRPGGTLTPRLMHTASHIRWSTLNESVESQTFAPEDLDQENAPPIALVDPNMRSIQEEIHKKRGETSNDRGKIP